MRLRYAQCALWLCLALPKALPTPMPPERFTVTVQEQITQTAVAQGVPPSVALAVAQKESSFNQGARGTSGEVGLFQLMPATAAGLKVNAYDQTANITGGVSLLAQLYRQFGSWATALAHYNGGTNPPASSYSYAQSVLDISQVYGAADSSGVDVSYDDGSGYDLASTLPDLSAIPNWVWLATVGAVGLLLFLKRD